MQNTSTAAQYADKAPFLSYLALLIQRSESGHSMHADCEVRDVRRHTARAFLAYRGPFRAGFQNDYFDPNAILRSVVEDNGGIDRVRATTLGFLKAIEDLPVTIIATPIQFTDDYSELVDPVGILKTISECGAFRRDAPGGQPIPELEAMGSRIMNVPGKRGLNAFSNTELDRVLREREIRDVILAGVVTSVCIDSTGRSAHERGFSVTVLSDCTGWRTSYEQDFYCSEVFPLYAEVKTSEYRQFKAPVSSEHRSLSPAIAVLRR